MKNIMWQYCTNLNDINRAIDTKDTNWEGLESAEQIINITYDTHHNRYVVFWRIDFKNRRGRYINRKEES